MSVEEKITVTYITSIGHSGSTILDILLETPEGSFSVGEVRYLTDACSSTRWKDGTGNSLQESEMWSSFCANIDKYTVSNKSDGNSLKKAGRLLSAKLKKNTYMYDNRALLLDIKKKASELKGKEVHTIIDSSKDPLRLAVLHKDRSINTKIIHLIRSPWGVVYSNVKRGRSLPMTCWQWLRTNLAIAWYLFFNVSSKKYVRILYKDLCVEPKKELDRITNQLIMDPIPSNYIEVINAQTSYRFAGNGLKKRGDIKEIKLDESWRKGLSWYQKLVVGILCGLIYLVFWLTYHS